MKNRKPNRMPGYDYSLPGYYFVTMNVRNRVPVFGKILNGVMALNEYGKIAARCWNDIPCHVDNCEFDEYIIMPDHVHGIVVIDDSFHVVSPRGPRPRSRPRREQACLFPTGAGSRANTRKLPVIIGSYKSAVSKIIHNAGYTDFKWQKSYHDRIIRDQDELNTIRKYIRQNPLRFNGTISS